MPHVVVRDIVLLLCLGNIIDEAIAVDTALHFWYSAFMPIMMEYQLSISSEIVSFFTQADGSGRLGKAACGGLSLSLSEKLSMLRSMALQRRVRRLPKPVPGSASSR
jgi:hypothetical protein